MGETETLHTDTQVCIDFIIQWCQMSLNGKTRVISNFFSVLSSNEEKQRQRVIDEIRFDRERKELEERKKRQEEIKKKEREDREHEMMNKRKVGRPQIHSTETMNNTHSNITKVYNPSNCTFTIGGPPTVPLPVPPLSDPVLPQLSQSSSSSSSSTTSSSSSLSNPTLGTQGRPSHYVDWLSDFHLFQQIVNAMDIYRTPRGALNHLQMGVKAISVDGKQVCAATDEIFQKLSINSIRNWYTSCNNGTKYSLKPYVYEKWQHGNHEPRSNGRPYFLSTCKDLHEQLVKLCVTLREESIAVNSRVLFPIFKSFLEKNAIEFIPSRRYIRGWIRRHLKFSYKKATNNRRKLPPDWELQKEKFINRVTATAAQFSIDYSDFIINWDQTAVMLVPHAKYTYSEKGSSGVSVIGIDDKRQITAVVATTFSGELLPLQLIFGGKKSKDPKKKNKKSVPKCPDLHDEIKSWHLTQTESHWSNLESMKDYVKKIIVPFVNKKAEEGHLEQNPPRAILILDCWETHKGRPFLEWMKQKYPQFKLIFVPARCTGEIQPCDLFVQRPFKCEITNQFNDWTASSVIAQLNNGNSLDSIARKLGIKDMKKKTVEWCLSALNKMKEAPMKNMIQQGINDLGFDKMFTSENKIKAITYCTDHNIEIKNSIEAMVAQESESNPMSNSDAIEIQVELQDASRDNEDIAYAPLPSSAIVLENIISRRRTRQSRRQLSSEEDARFARELQEEEFKEMD